MKIIDMQIDGLQPYERNPRRNDDAVKYVAESIREFGFKVPIVIDENGVIVAGHTRFKAAKKLGFDTVPCIVADDLTEEQIKAFRLADNKVAEKADWDFELLAVEIDEIFDFDMTVFGFEDVEEQFEPNDLDKEDEKEGTCVITIRFDNQRNFANCKNEIESIVNEYGGRLSVKME